MGKEKKLLSHKDIDNEIEKIEKEKERWFDRPEPWLILFVCLIPIYLVLLIIGNTSVGFIPVVEKLFFFLNAVGVFIFFFFAKAKIKDSKLKKLKRLRRWKFKS